MKEMRPLGVIPNKFWKEILEGVIYEEKNKRRNALRGAIERYMQADLKPLPEWLEEHNALIDELYISPKHKIL